MSGLPSELDAERAVIGRTLSSDRDTAAELIAQLQPPDFIDIGHDRIWSAICEVYAAGLSIDIVTVSHRMRVAGTLPILSQRGAEAYLSQLAIEWQPGTVDDYAKLIIEAATLRRLAVLCDDLRAAALGRRAPAIELLAELQRDAAALADRGIVHPVQHIKGYLNEEVRLLAARTEDKRAVPGVPTGLRDLDGKIGGYCPGDLDIVAGRPSMGKTAFIVSNMLGAAYLGYPVLFFSLEMTAQKITERILAHDSHVSGTNMQTGYLDGTMWTRIYSSTSRLSTLPFYLDDAPRQTLAKMEAKARKWRRDRSVFPTGKELGLIAIDYLQLIRVPPQWNSKRNQEIGEITKELKALAKDLNLPIVVLSQLNRELEKRPDKRPIMSDLAESGAIEQDADVICFLYRDEKYNPETEDRGIAEVIVGKQRNGPPGTVKVKFFEAETRFADLSPRSGY